MQDTFYVVGAPCCCARTPRRCRSAPCWRSKPPVRGSSSRARVPPRRPTPRTRRCSTRSRGCWSTDRHHLRRPQGHARRSSRRAFFGARHRAIRFRPSFFPFTEPSAEVDVLLLPVRRQGLPGRASRPAGWRSSAAGMVASRTCCATAGYDPERSPAAPSAWASSASRCCKYGIDDIRLFFENDLRFLRQFS